MRPGAGAGAQTSASLRIPGGGEATLKVVDGELWFGATPERCPGFTTSNVTQIEVNRLAGASTTPGTTERLILDLRTGALGPGAPNETNQLSEIEVLVNLGDASDEVVVIGGDADDTFTAGVKGVSLNTDNDVDVEFAQPYLLELRGNGGADVLSALGGLGASSSYPSAVRAFGGDGADRLNGGLGNDRLEGGADADVLDGRTGNDVLDGGSGNDTLTGGAGDDDLTGGAGADSLTANDGTDFLHANDGEADTLLSGGAGDDTAYYDLVLDPNPAAVEHKIGT